MSCWVFTGSEDAQISLFFLHIPSWSIFWGARTFWPTSKERRWGLRRLSEVSRWSGLFRAAHETILSAPGNGFPFPFQPRSLTILLRPNLLEYRDTWFDTFIQCVSRHRAPGTGPLWACFGTYYVSKGFYVIPRLDGISFRSETL